METHVNYTRYQILLYYFASSIGLAPFSIGKNTLRPVGFLRKGYAVILAILSSLWIYFVLLNHRVEGIEVTFVNKFVFALMLTLFGGNLWATLLIFAFKSNKMIDVMNQITAIKEELKNLGIDDNSGENCEYFYARIIATNSVVLLMRIIVGFGNFDHNHDHGTTFLAMYWIGRIVIAIHIHSGILIFVETMTCTRKLFESLNNKLQNTVKANCTFLSTAESVNIQSSVEDIEKIEKLHRELCDLVESTTHFHTVPLLFAIIRHFSNILSNCYSLYAHVFILHDVFETTEAILPWVQRLVGWTTITMLELFLIAHASTSVSRVGNATKAILHESWNKYHPEKLRDELSKLSLQLLHKPVAVLAFGFFDLGYSLIYKIFRALIAYLIIMIQFDAQRPNLVT